MSNTRFTLHFGLFPPFSRVSKLLPASFHMHLPASSQWWSCFGSSEGWNKLHLSVWTLPCCICSSAPLSRVPDLSLSFSCSLFSLPAAYLSSFTPLKIRWCVVFWLFFFTDLDQSWTVFKKIPLIRFSYLLRFLNDDLQKEKSASTNWGTLTCFILSTWK